MEVRALKCAPQKQVERDFRTEVIDGVTAKPMIFPDPVFAVPEYSTSADETNGSSIGAIDSGSRRSAWSKHDEMGVLLQLVIHDMSVLASSAASSTCKFKELLDLLRSDERWCAQRITRIDSSAQSAITSSQLHL